MIWVLYPSSFLHGQGAYFENGDAPQHVTGWLFFAHDAWHFPLLHTSLLNYPHGTSIAFTDSIPLAALLLKPFAAWLPEQFHYIGLWHGLAYILQALGAVALIRALGVRHLPGAIAAAAMSVMWPTLYWRMAHTSLMTHGLVLFALALYFSARKAGGGTVRIGLLQIGLSVAALLIHPYLFAMCYPVFVATLADQALSGKGWKAQGGLLVLSLIVIAGVGAVLGYFGHGNTVTGGFGEHALNLAAPVCGGSLVECPFDASPVYGEGFTYFGAGALLVILAGMALRAGSFVSMFRRYPALIVLMLLFFLYALSPTVRWGSHVAVSGLYKIPSSLESLTGTFRASARFFWPVAYLIFFAALSAVLRARPLLTAAVLVLAIPLQWMDTTGLRATVKTLAAAPSGDDLSKWEPLMKDVSAVRLYPAYTCGDASDQDYLLAQRLAARYGKTIDTGHIARLKVDCELNARTFGGSLAPGALYLLPMKHLGAMQLNLPAGFRKAASRGECAETARFIVCRPDTSPAYWSNKAVVTRHMSGFPDASAQWDGAQLSGNIGRVAGSHRLADGSDPSGFLTFGPYAKVAPGAYRFKLLYASTQAPGTRIGWWDVVALDDGGQSLLVTKGDLHGSAGTEKEISGDFTIKGSARRIEIRTYLEGGHDLRVQRLTIAGQAQDSLAQK
jgi:hypothetical protein